MLSTSPSYYCCKDHFNVKEDLENYVEFSLMKGSVRPRWKQGILPSRFHCQNRNENTPTKRLQESESNASKKFKSDIVQEMQDEPCCSKTLYLPSKQDKIIQANIKPNVRSKATMVLIKTKTQQTSPIKCLNQIENIGDTSEDDRTLGSSPEKTISYVPTSDSSDNLEEYDTERFKEYMRKGSLMAIEREPRLMLGIPKNTYYIIKFLEEKIPIPLLHILIVLKKLRLNNSFALLAVDFGMSLPNISKIFHNGLRPLAQTLQELVYWPPKAKVRMNLPVAFRYRFKKVVSLIDCLEIEIEKPSNAVHQALTWSSYKKSNTAKYLISCTPDGLISFVSPGYGGRASDSLIVEKSGYLNLLEPGMEIMADRGFKSISGALSQRGCHLVRPPSLSQGQIQTEEDARQSKRIAAVRIHVERVISRLREFKILLPHSCVDNHLVQFIDFFVIIVCALVNILSKLKKQECV